jgi:hypothetical protein
VLATALKRRYNAEEPQAPITTLTGVKDERNGLSERIVEPDGTGRLTAEQLATGERHTLVVRRLVLDHRYHDEDPVQRAEFSVTFENGLVVSGQLDAEGKATLIGVPERGQVRYGPDQRAFARVDSGSNPDYRGPLAEIGFDSLRAKHGG